MSRFNTPTRLFLFNNLPPSEGLVAAWNLSDVTDSFGVNDLTNNGAATFVAGKINNAVLLDGVNDSLSIVDNAALSFGAGKKLSICGWFNVTDTSVRRTILGKYTSAGNQREYLLFVEPTGFLRFIVTANGITDVVVSSAAGTILPNVWYFFTVWYDGVNINLEINNNGTIVSTAHSTDIFNGTSDFKIGQFDGGSFFIGRIDAVRIYKHDNRVLTNTERAELFHMGMGIEYAVNDKVNAGEVNAELNQLINLFNGTITDITPKISVDSVTPSLSINQLGGAPILQGKGNGALAFEVLNNGVFKSYLPTGNAPFTLAAASAGEITNLNVDKLDDLDSTDILRNISTLTYIDSIVMNTVVVGVSKKVGLSGDILTGLFVKPGVAASSNSSVTFGLILLGGGLIHLTFVIPNNILVTFYSLNENIGDDRIVEIICLTRTGTTPPQDVTVGLITTKSFVN